MNIHACYHFLACTKVELLDLTIVLQSILKSCHDLEIDWKKPNVELLQAISKLFPPQLQ